MTNRPLGPSGCDTFTPVLGRYRYHIFGLAALQLADDHGLTPFWAMRMGAEWFNSRAGELRQDFPTSAFGGRLTNYAVALENEMRRGSAVDPDKHCLNYAGIRAGVELGKELGQLRQPARFIPPPPSEGDILQPDTTVIYRSPLSLEIRGVRGETFAFDQRTKQFSGNTPQVIIEPLPEADGTWGLAVTPLFPVQSLQLRGAGTGPAEVGVYSYRARVAQVFPLQVRDGEALEVTDWRGTPVLRQNGAPVIAFGAPPPAATVPPTAGKVGQLVVCRTVEGGQPQGAADRFAQAARLTCFWRYRDRPTTTVTCVWSRAGKEILRSEREVGGSGSVWFSIATRAAAGLASGDWTVALLAGNEVLARRRFQIGEE